MTSGAHNETVETCLMDWLRYRVQPRVRERTYHNYHDMIIKHILPTLGHMKLQQITGMHIQKLYDLKRQQQSLRTIYHIHIILRRALDDAVQLHHL